MKKISSEKNKPVRAIAAAMVMLLCLGGFFVFFGKRESGAHASLSDNTETTLFLSGNAAGADISVSARSAVLIEASSGEVIWAKNPDTRMPMASTTKTHGSIR